MEYNPGMVTLTIKLPAALKQQLEREAAQSGRSVSALIREAVHERIRAAPRSGSLYDRTRDLCGAGGSGRPDLATDAASFSGFGE